MVNINIESIFAVKVEFNSSQTFQVSQSQKKEMSIDITTRMTKTCPCQKNNIDLKQTEIKKKYNTIQIQCTIVVVKIKNQKYS